MRVLAEFCCRCKKKEVLEWLLCAGQAEGKQSLRVFEGVFRKRLQGEAEILGSNSAPEMGWSGASFGGESWAGLRFTWTVQVPPL